MRHPYGKLDVFLEKGKNLYQRNKKIYSIGTIYLLFIFSNGTQNTYYFQKWIAGLVQGDFFALYHVIPHVGSMTTENLTVPYPPFSLYTMGIVAKILIFFGGQYQSVFLIASNLTSVIFTFLTTTVLAFWIKGQGNSNVFYYMVTPAVFIVSPLLGYQDSIMSFFILGALLAYEKEMYLMTGIAASMAIFSKQLAVMPMFGLGILILLSLNRRMITKTAIGFVSTSTLILYPFISTGTLAGYFHAQGLASVHTMMSAQNPNFPWLISVIKRITTHGLFSVQSYSSSPYQIENRNLRQIIYLTFAMLTILIIINYVFIWTRKLGALKISSLYVGAVSISAYNLFSFGVHENHVFMLLPVLFAIIDSQQSKLIYIVVSSALGLNLLSTGGLGMSFSTFPILAQHSGFAYSLVGGTCFVAYGWAFFAILRQNPGKKSN